MVGNGTYGQVHKVSSPECRQCGAAETVIQLILFECCTASGSYLLVAIVKLPPTGQTSGGCVENWHTNCLTCVCKTTDYGTVTHTYTHGTVTHTYTRVYVHPFDQYGIVHGCSSHMDHVGPTCEDGSVGGH